VQTLKAMANKWTTKAGNMFVMADAVAVDQFREEGPTIELNPVKSTAEYPLDLHISSKTKTAVISQVLYHYVHIYLGDLERYRRQFRNTLEQGMTGAPAVNQGWGLAREHYTKAMTLYPRNARYAFSDRNLHSRMPLHFMPLLRFKQTCV
jgi:hypothetical protein